MKRRSQTDSRRMKYNPNAAGEAKAAKAPDTREGSAVKVQWYPGHMAKTRRVIAENLKQVDAVCEILDARIPASSRNPDMDALTAGKARLIILNRADQADPDAAAKWADFYRSQDTRKNMVLRVDSKSGRGIARFAPAIRELLAGQLQAWENKGQSGHIIRVMVLGIPNVGKSTFINRVAGSNRAKAENRPGVTRGKQWIVIDKRLELLDTPGILWPKFEDPAVGERLAWTGAVKDEILDMETLGCDFIAFLAERYPDALLSGYRLEQIPDRLPGENTGAYGYKLLKLAGGQRGCRISGGEIDTERMARIILDEFRSGKLGRFTLEFPDEK